MLTRTARPPGPFPALASRGTSGVRRTDRDLRFHRYAGPGGYSELARPRPARRHLSPARRPVSYKYPSSGRRPNPRLLRGGSFTQPANVRSADRNRYQPSDRNINNGFRPASTLRRSFRICRPNPKAFVSFGVCRCKSRSSSRVERRALFGQARSWLGGSGRSSDSNASPTVFLDSSNYKDPNRSSDHDGCGQAERGS